MHIIASCVKKRVGRKEGARVKIAGIARPRNRLAAEVGGAFSGIVTHAHHRLCLESRRESRISLFAEKSLRLFDKFCRKFHSICNHGTKIHFPQVKNKQLFAIKANSFFADTEKLNYICNISVANIGGARCERK